MDEYEYNDEEIRFDDDVEEVEVRTGEADATLPAVEMTKAERKRERNRRKGRGSGRRWKRSSGKWKNGRSGRRSRDEENCQRRRRRDVPEKKKDI